LAAAFEQWAAKNELDRAEARAAALSLAAEAFDRERLSDQLWKVIQRVAFTGCQRPNA
jgi:hypothetical protein